MFAEPSILYKLMILYILDTSEFPLTNSQVCDFLLSNDYTTYFTTQATISDLIEAKFITVTQQNNSTYYELTTSGKETLDAFSSEISDDIKADIRTFLEKMHNLQVRKNEVLASYVPTYNQNFEVELAIKDNKDPLLNIILTVSTEQQAEIICDHWQKKSGDVYDYLLATLLS